MVAHFRRALRSSLLLSLVSCWLVACGGGGSSGSGKESDSGLDGRSSDGTTPVQDTGAADTSSSVDSTVVQDSGTDTGSPGVGDSGPEDSAVDTSSPDTGVADSGENVPETGDLDSGAPDTATADTSVADSNVADSGVVDSTVADTGVSMPDTSVSEASAGDSTAADTSVAEAASESGVVEAGADAPSDATVRYLVQVNVTGLAASDTLALQDNGTDQLLVTMNGTTPFDTSLASGAAYAVTVKGNPTTPISEACTVANGTGTIGSSNVTVNVTCASNSYTIGGTLTGVPAGTVVLQNNNGNNLSLTAAGPFAFTTSQLSGTMYSVTVLTQPNGVVTCTPSMSTGTVGSGNVNSVVIACAPSTSGMIGYWNFNETTGTTAADSSGNSLSGTLTGSASFTPGAGVEGSGAVTFSGGYVDVAFPNNAIAQGTGIFLPVGNVTYTMWVKTTASSIQGLQVTEGVHWNSGCDRVVGNSSGGVLNYEDWQEDNFLGVTPVNDGSFHLVAYVMDETNGLIGYVDGLIDGTGTVATQCGIGCSGFNWASDYWIGTGAGCRGNVGGAFTGIIDDVRIYNRPLSAADVSALYQATK